MPTKKVRLDIRNPPEALTYLSNKHLSLFKGNSKLVKLSLICLPLSNSSISSIVKVDSSVVAEEEEEEVVKSGELGESHGVGKERIDNGDG